MGRSNTNSSNLISGESDPAYLPSFPTMPGHHHSHPLQNNIHPSHHAHLNNPHPSPPHAPFSHGQYLSVSHLTNVHLYETNNNITPPNRVYSPLSHGSNGSPSSGNSALSYVSNASGHNSTNENLTIMEPINSSSKYEYEDFPQEPDGGPVKISTWKDHVAVFNIEQVGVMCDVLLQNGDITRLVDLLSTVGKDFVGRSEKILRAQAHVAFHAALDDPRKFPQVYKILETNKFSQQYHRGLQKLWEEAHYKEAEITRGRPLGAVDRYRIRRKFNFPLTIWDGEAVVYCFKERSRCALRESFRLEKYPNLEEKKKLSKETGLTMTQVGNWFKNKRQREKEKEQGKAGSKKRCHPGYDSPGAIPPAMNPELLGMMLNPVAVNLSHGHLHQHHYQQQQLAPMSPEEFENSIKRARLEDTRVKSYMDEGMYSSAAPVPPNSSNLSSYLHSHNNGSINAPRHLVLPGKSDITIGIVGSPGSHQHQQSARPANNNGLTITAVHSPSTNNNSSSLQAQAHHHQQQPSHSPNAENDGGGGNGNADSPPGPISDGNSVGVYGSRPRSNSAISEARCGSDLVHHIHTGGHHHHIYHHHHHHHANQSMASPVPVSYDSGIAPLIHSNSVNVGLSHA